MMASKNDHHVSVSTVVDRIRDEFDEILLIHADFVPEKNPNQVIFSVYTPEADMTVVEDYRELFDGRTQMLVEQTDGTERSLSFRVMAVCDGPGTIGGVTVYRDGSWPAREPIPVDEGLNHLRQLLSVKDENITVGKNEFGPGFVASHLDSTGQYQGATPREAVEKARKSVDSS